MRDQERKRRSSARREGKRAKPHLSYARAPLFSALVHRRAQTQAGIGRLFIVRDANCHALAYVYFEAEPGWRSAAHLLTRAPPFCSTPQPATQLVELAYLDSQVPVLCRTGIGFSSSMMTPACAMG
jgi:hypothetical protein